MESNHITTTKMYEEQLKQVKAALEITIEGPERNELLTLKDSIEELLLLTRDSTPSTSNQGLDDEYALFMSELRKEDKSKIEETKNLEGMKCRAPHKHQWGSIVYHNAMICSVCEESFDINVKVLFTNPTHQEMLPCPYFFDSDCKFSAEKCRFSHGEVVPFSQLQDYIEPKFDLLTIGSFVLAKDDKLWRKAVVRKLYGNKCLVCFESNQKEAEKELEYIFPLLNELGQIESKSDDEEEKEEEEEEEEENVINMSLMIEPSGQALGNWEKYTKGIGSKMMEKMGYVIGTGLGKKSNGIIDPVTAVILPTGKSLDYCMNLRERAGGDKNLFSVERKLKRLQKRQEIQNKKAYEREQNKTDVFKFLNNTLSKPKLDKVDRIKHKKQISSESSRNLNVASLVNVENIKKVEKEMENIMVSLSRHTDVKSQMHKNLKIKLLAKQCELKELQTQFLNISNEQKRRSDARKMTIF